MKILLRLKHWQLFLLLILPHVLLDFAVIVLMLVSLNLQLMFLVVAVVMVFTTGIFFAWLYAMGTKLHKKLPQSVKMNLTTFKIFLLIPFAYILLICIFMLEAINEVMINEELRGPGMIGVIGLIILIHLFSIFCIFYCLYFNAKVLKAVELQRPVFFGDYAGEFFLLLFFPVGVWFIQPRLNRLFS